MAKPNYKFQKRQKEMAKKKKKEEKRQRKLAKQFDSEEPGVDSDDEETAEGEESGDGE